ncbi:MAG: VOC family protein [Bauldia sp.]|nr:VOC family protein [Verrucomicrobiae bacterium]MCB1499489.1 VOC family protein [Bauldia sp.]
MPGSKRQTGSKKPGAKKSPTAARPAPAKRPPSVKTKKAAPKAASREAAAASARKPPASKAGKAAAAPSTRKKPDRKPSVRAAAPATVPARQSPIPSQPHPLRRGSDLSFALNKLHQVALLANDLDRSVAFYRDVLGLHYVDRYDPPGLAFFSLGSGVRLILSATSSKATLYFLVDDIDAAFRVLAQRGVSFLHKPAMIHRDDEGRLGKKGVEEWMAFFKDPADNVLALVARR